jgi:hypothetical protein
METDRHASTIVDAQCGVSWAAVAAGAVGAAALALLLTAFGAGLGLSAISPWSDSGVSASTLKTGTGIYLVIMAVMSSRRLSCRSVANKMGGSLHARGFLSRYRTRFSRLGLCNAFKRDRPEFGRGISCKNATAAAVGGAARKRQGPSIQRTSTSISSSARAPRRLRPHPRPIPRRRAMLLPINRGQK